MLSHCKKLGNGLPVLINQVVFFCNPDFTLVGIGDKIFQRLESWCSIFTQNIQKDNICWNVRYGMKSGLRCPL